jgi:hypothetical protein
LPRATSGSTCFAATRRAIFQDRIPHKVMSWITVKNSGFSDAADLFVFHLA